MARKKNPNNEGRQSILRAFRKDPSASMQELVRATGYSQTTVYYHLHNLMDEGVITRENKKRDYYDRTVTKKRSQHKEARKAFVRRAVLKKKDGGLDARIDAVVAMAKAAEKLDLAADVYGDNVFRNRHTLSRRFRVRGSRIG